MLMCFLYQSWLHLGHTKIMVNFTCEIDYMASYFRNYSFQAIVSYHKKQRNFHDSTVHIKKKRTKWKSNHHHIDLRYIWTRMNPVTFQVTLFFRFVCEGVPHQREAGGSNPSTGGWSFRQVGLLTNFILGSYRCVLVECIEKKQNYKARFSSYFKKRSFFVCNKVNF